MLSRSHKQFYPGDPLALHSQELIGTAPNHTVIINLDLVDLCNMCMYMYCLYIDAAMKRNFLNIKTQWSNWQILIKIGIWEFLQDFIYRFVFFYFQSLFFWTWYLHIEALLCIVGFMDMNCQYNIWMLDKKLLRTVFITTHSVRRRILPRKENHMGDIKSCQRFLLLKVKDNIW